MGLVKTPIVDKNGRLTTVHKRSGEPTVSSSRLASVKPKLSPAPKKPKPHQMDRIFSMNADAGFEKSHLGAILNSMYPDKAIDSGSIFNKEICVTSREIYAVARHGVNIREAATLAHFGIKDLDGIKAVVARGGKEFKSPPAPWIDALNENDIDIFALHASMANDMDISVLKNRDPELVADIVRAYGYKSLKGTGIPELVAEGMIDWDDIQEVGVSRCSKNEWSVKNFLDRRTPRTAGTISYPYLPTERFKAAVIETEKRPRKTNFTWKQRDENASDQIVTYARSYEYLGEDIDDVHMPEIVLALNKEELVEPEQDHLALVMHCDEVIHRVRSDRKLSTEIGRHIGMDRTYGAVMDEYAAGTGAVEPIWNVKELAEYHERGLSVDETVEALQRNLKPAQAEGVFRSGVAASVSDGWL